MPRAMSASPHPSTASSCPRHPPHPQDSTAQKQLAPASIRDSSFFFRLPRRGSSLYGFVFCRQRQDEALRRGAEQRSFVVLSPLPLHALWTALACAAGPVCLAYGPHAVVDVSALGVHSRRAAAVDCVPWGQMRGCGAGCKVAASADFPRQTQFVRLLVGPLRRGSVGGLEYPSIFPFPPPPPSRCTRRRLSSPSRCLWQTARRRSGSGASS